MQLSVQDRIMLMKELALAKVSANTSNPGFIPEIEKMLETIAGAKLANCAPVNENLLGLSFILLMECKRLRF